MNHIIETKDLRKEYPQAGQPHKVLKGVDIQVDPGEGDGVLKSLRDASKAKAWLGGHRLPPGFMRRGADVARTTRAVRDSLACVACQG